MAAYQQTAGRVALAVAVLLAAPCAADEAEEFFKRLDRNRDGKLTRDEFPEQIRRMFDRVDANGDGAVTLEEDRAFRAARSALRPGAQANRGGRQRQAGSVKQISNIPYAGTTNPRQTLDLILPVKPAGETPLPVVAFIHGGGWRGGNKSGGVGRVARYAAGGNYAGVSVGYRLTGEAIWPAQIHDCKAAIRWIRANAKTYNLDEDKIGVWGTSAGGHLVAMLGTSGGDKAMDGTIGPNAKHSSRVTCVVDCFGPTDFLQMDAHRPARARLTHDEGNSPESLLIGGPIRDNRDKVASANPITYVSKDAPPFLIAHGTADPLVPFHQSELLDAAFRKAGLKPIFLHVVGAGHGFGGAEFDSRVRAFFDKHLRGRKVDVSSEPIKQGGERRGR